MTYAEEEEAIMNILDEIYETFVISCILSGRIEINDFWNKKEKYMDHGWVKQPKKWIDPLKESSATKTALNTGQKTYKQIAAESGRDWRQQIDDTAEVIEYARKKGVDMEGVIFGGKTQKQPAEPEGGEGKPNPSEGDNKPGEDGDTNRKKEKNLKESVKSGGSIRAMEGEGNERKFILSFSSEEPYQRWFGQEIPRTTAKAQWTWND